MALGSQAGVGGMTGPGGAVFFLQAANSSKKASDRTIDLLIGAEANAMDRIR